MVWSGAIPPDSDINQIFRYSTPKYFEKITHFFINLVHYMIMHWDKLIVIKYGRWKYTMNLKQCDICFNLIVTVESSIVCKG